MSLWKSKYKDCTMNINTVTPFFERDFIPVRAHWSHLYNLALSSGINYEGIYDILEECKNYALITRDMKKNMS